MKKEQLEKLVKLMNKTYSAYYVEDCVNRHNELRQLVAEILKYLAMSEGLLLVQDDYGDLELSSSEEEL